MSWVKIDDVAPEHPKLLEAGALAAWLWLCALAYCNRQKARDGFIPEAKVKLLYPGLGSKEAKRLVEVGLWDVCASARGYLIHDYAIYQGGGVGHDSELSEKRATAGRLGGKRSGEVRTKQVASFASKQNEASASSKTKQPDEATLTRAQTRAGPIPSDPDLDPDPSSTDLSGLPRESGQAVEDDPDFRRIKPQTSPLTAEDYGQLELGDPGLNREFADAALTDWLTEPSDPKLELFGRQWRTTAVKVARSAWRDARRRREIQAKLGAPTDGGRRSDVVPVASEADVDRMLGRSA